jgi:hypothetical protein
MSQQPPHNPPQAASAAAHALSSPKHGKHDVVPEEVQAAYASYESSHGKALPAGSRIETKDAVYVVEDEAKQRSRTSPSHSPKQSSVSQSVQNKFSAIDRQIKSGRKPQSPTQSHHAPRAGQHQTQHAGQHQTQHAAHVGQHAPGATGQHATQHSGHQALHHPVQGKYKTRRQLQTQLQTQLT